MKLFVKISIVTLMFGAFLSGVTNASQQIDHVLGFTKAIRVAQQNDPWLSGNYEKQKSLESA